MILLRVICGHKGPPTSKLSNGSLLHDLTMLCYMLLMKNVGTIVPGFLLHVYALLLYSSKAPKQRVIPFVSHRFLPALKPFTNQGSNSICLLAVLW